MGDFPLISLIGNSKVVIVASILSFLLFFLSSIVDYLDSCSDKYPPKDCWANVMWIKVLVMIFQVVLGLVVLLHYLNLGIDNKIMFFLF